MSIVDSQPTKFFGYIWRLYTVLLVDLLMRLCWCARHITIFNASFICFACRQDSFLIRHELKHLLYYFPSKVGRKTNVEKWHSSLTLDDADSSLIYEQPGFDIVIWRAMSVRNLNQRIILGLSATQMIKQLVLRFLECFLFLFKVVLYGQLALLATNEKK